jgi:hypothetical protein
MQFSELLEQKFIRKFEHDGLLNLQLICNDAVKYSRGIRNDNRTLFEPFAQKFMEEAKRKKHRMVFNVKMCPGVPGTYDANFPELIWTERGNIMSYYYNILPVIRWKLALAEKNKLALSNRGSPCGKPSGMNVRGNTN